MRRKSSRSFGETRAATTRKPFTVCACDTMDSISDPAVCLRRASTSRSRSRLCRSRRSTEVSSSDDGGTLRSRPRSLSRARSDRATCWATAPVAASARRTPAATPPSDRRRKVPTCPVALRCVPPQSSRLQSPIFTTRTTSPYFSPNRAIAPRARASSRPIRAVETGKSSRTLSLTISSILSICSCSDAVKCVKSNRSLSGATRDPAWWT